MRFRVLGALFALLFSVSFAFAGDKVSVEELVSKHVDSIITSKMDKPALGRASSGVAVRDILLGGAGHREGKASFVSKDNSFQLILDFNSAEYQGEQYTWDGSNTRVGASGVDKFSALAQFVRMHDVILRDGLFGGVLNNGWALMNLAAHNSKLHYDGMKKFNGKPAHQVTYTSKRVDNDMTIRLYFEPETFRHIGSTYEYESQMTAMAGNMPSSEKLIERVEESFSDFKPEGGLTLPHHWQLRYLQEHGASLSIRFEMSFAQIATGSQAAGAGQ
jgi:hypothetical protein